MQKPILSSKRRLDLALVIRLSGAEDFDKDRQEILDRLDACIAPRKQLHELEWELRKRSEEVRELQQVRQPRGHLSLVAFMDAIWSAEPERGLGLTSGSITLSLFIEG